MSGKKKLDLVHAHDRKFGVEIECGMPGGYDARYRAVQDLFGFGGSYRNADGWTIGADGSGVELRTPILQGRAGLNTLRKAMDRLKEAGAYVTTADGLHVHHDAPEFVDSPTSCLQLVESWRNNQDAIHEMVAPRRHRSQACPRWSNNYFDVLKQWVESNGRNYLSLDRHDLNLLSLDEHGSIEFRLHEGTLDADVAIAWIQFGQKFLHEVLRRVNPIKASATDVALMSRMRLSKKAQAILAEKKRMGHITEGTKFRPRGTRA